MVDPARVRTLLDRLAEELTHLQRLAASPETKTATNPDILAAIKYRFVVAIETCIDIGQHVISSEGLRSPADLADVFVVLGETDFLTPDLVQPLQQMARFRNLLVHGYLRVDDSRVLEILNTDLEDFVSFKREIAKAALEG